MTHSERSPDEVARLLAGPFPPGTVKYRPGAVSGHRALALPYVDARAVQEKLDEAVGVMGWQDAYDHLEDGSVVCRLKLRIGGEWICKTDVGSPSGQPDEGDRHKAAVSDALKRAAVKFGVGRYLYQLEAKWVDYDPRTKQLRGLPSPAVAPAPAAAPPGPCGPAPPTPEEVKRELEHWRGWLDDVRPDLAAFNETVRADMPDLPKAAKRPVWQMLCGHAEREGWVWDPAKNGFARKQQEKAKAS